MEHHGSDLWLLNKVNLSAEPQEKTHAIECGMQTPL